MTCSTGTIAVVSTIATAPATLASAAFLSPLLLSLLPVLLFVVLRVAPMLLLCCCCCAAADAGVLDVALPVGTCTFLFCEDGFPPYCCVAPIC